MSLSALRPPVVNCPVIAAIWVQSVIQQERKAGVAHLGVLERFETSFRHLYEPI